MPPRELTLEEMKAALERKRAGKTQAEQAAEWSSSLRLFVEAAWPVIEPATPFVNVRSSRYTAVARSLC